MRKSLNAFYALILGLSLIPVTGFASDKDLEIVVHNTYATMLGEQPHDSASPDKAERKKAHDDIKLDNRTNAVLAELKYLKKHNPSYKTALLSLEKNYKSCEPSAGTPHIILDINNLQEDAKSFKLSFDMPNDGKRGLPDGCNMNLVSPYGEEAKKSFDTAVVGFMQACAASLAGKNACPAQNVSTDVKPFHPVDTAGLTVESVNALSNTALGF